MDDKPNEKTEIKVVLEPQDSTSLDGYDPN